jgi:predicted membrane protein
MSRYWVVLPVIVMAAVPVWTSPSDIVIAIVGSAAILCILGALARLLAFVTAGAVIGAIAYAVAVTSSAGGADVVAAVAFGLALLVLFDVSEFARRKHGATVSPEAMHHQLVFWFSRAGIVAGVTAALLLCAAAVAMIIPGSARTVVAGAGVLIGFAGALRAGIGRRGA